MSYNQYSGYGGNPYDEQTGAGGYGAPNPYGSDAGHPYGGGYGSNVSRRMSAHMSVCSLANTTLTDSCR